MYRGGVTPGASQNMRAAYIESESLKRHREARNEFHQATVIYVTPVIPAWAIILQTDVGDLHTQLFQVGTIGQKIGKLLKLLVDLLVDLYPPRFQAMLHL